MHGLMPLQMIHTELGRCKGEEVDVVKSIDYTATEDLLMGGDTVGSDVVNSIADKYSTGTEDQTHGTLDFCI